MILRYVSVLNAIPRNFWGNYRRHTLHNDLKLLGSTSSSTKMYSHVVITIGTSEGLLVIDDLS